MLYEPGHSQLKLLTSFTTAFEAEHLKLRLEAEGIPVTLDGIHASSNFGFNSTMGAVQVRVPNEHLAHAREVLEEADSQERTAWKCSQCHEDNEPSFDLCWKCGNQRSDWQPEPPPPSEYTVEDFRSVQSEAATYSSNPYAPPTAGDSFRLSAEQLERSEEAVRVALRLSIIGLFLVPPLGHIYAVAVLYNVAFQLRYLSSRTRMLWTIALLANLTLGCLLSWLWIVFLRG